MREPADPGAEPDRLARPTGEELFLNPLSDGRGAAPVHASGRWRAAAPNLSHFAGPEHVLRRLQLVDRGRGGPRGVAGGPRGREARGEDARLQLTDEEIDALVAYLYSLT